jgi:hypothetical protein
VSQEPIHFNITIATSKIGRIVLVNGKRGLTGGLLGFATRQIGLVSQEPILFNTTIAANIAYGKPGATLEEIISAAKSANAHDFISTFPDGYDTKVGSRGTQVSQRTSRGVLALLGWFESCVALWSDRRCLCILCLSGDVGRDGRPAAKRR